MNTAPRFRDVRGDETRDVSRLILGGPFGWEDEALSAAKLDRFQDAGGRLVETSYSYARGRSKEVIGAWLRSHPDGLGVVTKVGHDLRGGDIPLERRLVETHTDETRRALGVDALDVLMYHCDDPAREVAELADTLQGLVESGRAVRVGVSNWSAARLAELVAEFGPRADELVASYHFSLASPDPALLAPLGLAADRDILEVVRSNDIALISWSAHGQGYFSRTEPRATEQPDPFETPLSARRRSRAAEVADRLGSLPELVALAWTLHHEATWATIGPSTVSQLEASLRATELDLTPTDLEWILGESATRRAER